MHVFDNEGNYSKEYLDLLAQAKVKQLPEKLKTSDSNLAFHPRASYFRSTYPDVFSSSGNLPSKKKNGTSYQRTTYDKIDKREAREMSRQASFDSTIARAILERRTNSVVDRGLQLDLKPEYSILGIDEKESIRVAEDANKRFGMWANSKVSTDRTQTFHQFVRLMMYLQLRDGEYFIKFNYDNKSNTNPLTLSFVEPDLIYGNYNEKGVIPENKNIIDGIEYDKDGVEVAYYVSGIRNNQTERGRIPAVDKKSGLPLMTHGFSVEFVNQKRGFPLLYIILHECEQLSTFTLAQIESAIKQSSISMYIKPTVNDAVDWTQDVQAMRAGMRDIAEEDSSDDFESYLQYETLPEFNLSPGDTAVFNLKKGEDLKGFDTTSPTEQYSTFTKAFIQHLLIACNMSYEYFMMEFGENYSASRATLVLMHRLNKIDQGELESDALDLIKEIWCLGEIAANRIAMPGFSDLILRSAWLSCEWVGPPMVEIDQEKAVKAKKNELSIGATTFSRVARELNGTSYTGNVALIKQELENLPQVPWEEDKSTIDEGRND